MENCPNCNTTLKSGFMKTVELYDDIQIKLINEFSEDKKEYYCTACGRELLEQASLQLNQEIIRIKDLLQSKIQHIPLLSAHTPYNWKYHAIGIVTGQTVTGTGAVSEFKSGFTDFFGGQSGSFNKKIAEGEKMAFAQLQAKAMKMGGNAVIAVDIDYADVGTGKGMLMVCATGTAVKVDNTDVFQPHIQEYLIGIDTEGVRLDYLQKMFPHYITVSE